MSRMIDVDGVIVTLTEAQFTERFPVAKTTPPTAAEVRTAINAERDRRIRTPFTYLGHTFDYDDASQARITGAATLAGFAQLAGAELGDLRWHGGASDFVWIDHSNDLVPMDAATCLGFGKAAAAWESAHIFAARALKDRLDAGEDPASLDITQGWPEP